MNIAFLYIQLGKCLFVGFDFLHDFLHVVFKAYGLKYEILTLYGSMNIQEGRMTHIWVKFMIVVKYEILVKVQDLHMMRYNLCIIRAYSMNNFGSII